jgi:hypothetical protein
MKNLSKKMLASALIVFLVGCSTAQVPYTQNHLKTYQKVARAASHWDVLADDVAAQTMAALGTQKTLYVAVPAEATTFNRAFHNFLITRMVNKGIPVSTMKSGAVEVQYETQVVKHNSERRAYKPGTITMLAAGLMVAYNVPNWTNNDDKAAALLGLAGLADAGVSVDAGSPTKTELVVTTSVIEGGRYLTRKTDIYYLEPEDASLFEAMVMTTFRVSGDK